jgi:hypothetical protein
MIVVTCVSKVRSKTAGDDLLPSLRIIGKLGFDSAGARCNFTYGTKLVYGVKAGRTASLTA